MLECVVVVISLSHITVLLSFLVHAHVLCLWGARGKMDSFLFAFQIKLYFRKQHVPSKPNADGEKIQRHQDVSRTLCLNVIAFDTK